MLSLTAALLITLWWFSHRQARHVQGLTELPEVSIAAVLAGAFILVLFRQLWRMVTRPGELQPSFWQRRIAHDPKATKPPFGWERACTRTPHSGHTPTGVHLRWNAHGWSLVSDSPGPQAELAVDLRLRLDLQHWLLIEVHNLPDAAAGDIHHGGWLALSHRDHPEVWLALRRALYSPRPTSRPP